MCSVNILILLLCFSVDGRKVHFSHPFRCVTFENLCDGEASTLHINREDLKLTIWYRFPFQCHPHLVINQQVLVEDNNGVNAIFDILGCQYGFVGAKLYMGVKPIRSHQDAFPI